MCRTNNEWNHTRVFSPIAMLAAVCVLAGGVTTAHAAGGTVVGKVTLKGAPPPAPSPVNVAANSEQCGTQYEPDAMFGQGGSIRWAVVRIVGAKGEFPAQLPPPTLDQRTCRFTPHVVVVPVGRPLRVLNNDGILHNFHTFPTKNTPVNTAQPGFRKTMDAVFAAPEIVRVGCDVHPWMGAHIVVSETPFVAVTDENGAFSIDGVPAGSYTVSIWHEMLGEQTQQITVVEGQKTNLSVAMAAKRAN